MTFCKKVACFGVPNFGEIGISSSQFLSQLTLYVSGQRVFVKLKKASPNDVDTPYPNVLDLRKSRDSGKLSS